MIFRVSVPGLPKAAAVTLMMIIEEAKFAIEQARKAGADPAGGDKYHGSRAGPEPARGSGRADGRLMVL